MILSRSCDCIWPYINGFIAEEIETIMDRKQRQEVKGQTDKTAKRFEPASKQERNYDTTNYVTG